MEKILVKVTGKPPLLYRLQRHGFQLLDFEDESLSTLQRGVVLFFRMLPEIVSSNESVTA